MSSFFDLPKYIRDAINRFRQKRGLPKIEHPRVEKIRRLLEKLRK